MYAVAPGSQNKEWRYVCDNYFDTNLNGPNVACKELGKKAGHRQEDDIVTGNWVYWDNVRCSGLEKSLADCERPNPGICSPNEAVMLTCTGTQNFIWNFLDIISIICIVL